MKVVPHLICLFLVLMPSVLSAQEALVWGQGRWGVNAWALDSDGDLIPDETDVYPFVAIGILVDTDGDGAPDVCDQSCVDLGMSADLDDDNDGIPDNLDDFPLDFSEVLDTDQDGVGDNKDDDDDGDGYLDKFELDAGSDPLDSNDIPGRSGLSPGILRVIRAQIDHAADDI